MRPRRRGPAQRSKRNFARAGRKTMTWIKQPAGMPAAARLLRVALLNVWASWCVSCRIEHESLVQLAPSNTVAIDGLNYKDRREDALRWLDYYGNPYAASAVDAYGLVAIDYGVYRVPETFVIDSRGVIRHRHVGPIDRKALDNTILPLVRRLAEGRRWPEKHWRLSTT